MSTDVTIGLSQTVYSVVEGENGTICISVLSGDIAGRTITISYQTEHGDAQGYPYHTHYISYVLCIHLILNI